MRRKRGRGAKIYEGGLFAVAVFLSSGDEYVGGVKIYEVFYFSEAQVKTKKEEFSQK